MKNNIEEEYSVTIRCSVCNHCRYSPHLGLCINGGPYDGYKEEDQKESGEGEPHSQGPENT